MQQKDMARVGVGFLAAMNVIFFLGGLDRGADYLVFQFLGAAACVAAFRAPHDKNALAALFGGLAFVRLAQIVLDLSRLPVWLNFSIVIAESAAMAACFASRPLAARTAAWLVAVLFFVALVTTISSGRIAAMTGVLCGVIGFSLVAPNLAASPLREVRQEVVTG